MRISPADSKFLSAELNFTSEVKGVLAMRNKWLVLKGESRE